MKRLLCNTYDNSVMKLRLKLKMKERGPEGKTVAMARMQADIAGAREDVRIRHATQLNPTHHFPWSGAVPCFTLRANQPGSLPAPPSPPPPPLSPTSPAVYPLRHSQKRSRLHPWLPSLDTLSTQ